MVTENTAPREVFGELAERIGRGAWEQVAELYAPDVVVTNPFAPSGPVSHTGRESVLRFFTALGGQLDSLTITGVRLTDGADPQVLVAEFVLSATAGGGAAAFELPAVFLIRVRDGLIVESRDHIGPRRDLPADAAG